MTHTCKTALTAPRSGRVILLVALCLLFSIATGQAFAGADSKHFNLDGDGYAIERYDPVAYFTDGKAVPGDSAFTAEYDGAKYAFASEEHRQMFLGEPARYVPQYGGHCAYGAAYGTKSSIDPEIWDIVDGRLFFLINPGTMTVWQKRKSDYIRSADQAWQKLTSNSP